MNRRLSYSVEIMADQLIVAVTGKGTHCLGGCRRWLTSQAAMRTCNEAKFVQGSESCDVNQDVCFYMVFEPCM